MCIRHHAAFHFASLQEANDMAEKSLEERQAEMRTRMVTTPTRQGRNRQRSARRHDDTLNNSLEQVEQLPLPTATQPVITEDDDRLENYAERFVQPDLD
jgi:hypothetical protein